VPERDCQGFLSGAVASRILSYDDRDSGLFLFIKNLGPPIASAEFPADGKVPA
jgi:hypothetical protein